MSVYPVLRTMLNTFCHYLGVEEDHDVLLALKLAQLHNFPALVLQGEIRRDIPDFNHGHRASAVLGSG